MDEMEYGSNNPVMWPSSKYMPRSKSWGDRRIQLHPFPTTQLHGRSADGFFIHGGTEIGSHGCIDLGPLDGDFLDYCARRQKVFQVIVDYGSWKTAVPGKYGTIQWAKLK
jgi:hypothetical protein